MKILVLTHEFPPVGGGGGHVARDLCEGLSKRGHEIKLITADIKGGVDEENRRRNYELIRVPTLRSDPARASLPAMFSFLVSATVKGLSLIRHWRPDLIHAHFAVPSGPVAWVLSQISGLPYVLTIHLGDIPGGTPKKTDRWFRYIKPFTYPIWNHAARIVAVSSYSRQLALKHYQVQIEIIYNGVDLGLFTARELEVHQPPRIVFAGRFVPQKNPLAVVHTLAELKDLDWEMLMMGDGELFQAVKGEVQKLGLEDRVSLTGWVSPEEVRKAFLSSDILFMPSLSEGLPVVGVQALASGLAFVVSAIGGFSDLVNDRKNGYRLVTENSGRVACYKEALTELLSDTVLLQKFKENSAAKAIDFSLDKITRAYHDLFMTVRS